MLSRGETMAVPCVLSPRTWLLRVGWRKSGTLSDYLSFGYLADEPESVRRRNYLQFHRQHLPGWSMASRTARQGTRRIEGELTGRHGSIVLEAVAAAIAVGFALAAIVATSKKDGGGYEPVPNRHLVVAQL
jgi:hypothetical protein